MVQVATCRNPRFVATYIPIDCFSSPQYFWINFWINQHVSWLHPPLHRRLPAPPEAQNGGQTQQLPQEAAQDARPKAKGVDERQGAHRDDGTHLGSWANLGNLMGMYLER